MALHHPRATPFIRGGSRAIRDSKLPADSWLRPWMRELPPPPPPWLSQRERGWRKRTGRGRGLISLLGCSLTGYYARERKFREFSARRVFGWREGEEAGKRIELYFVISCGEGVCWDCGKNLRGKWSGEIVQLVGSRVNVYIYVENSG